MMLLMNKDLGPRTQRKVMMNDFSRKKNESTLWGNKKGHGGHVWDDWQVVNRKLQSDM